MRRVKNIKMTLIALIISICLIVGNQLKENLKTQQSAGNWFGTNHMVALVITLGASLLGSKFLPSALIQLALTIPPLRRRILKDLNVEGYWFVEWLTIPENDESREVKGKELQQEQKANGMPQEQKSDEKGIQACSGYELTQFSFTWDLDHLREKSINFSEPREAGREVGETEEERFTIGRCQLTNSIYQIHISDEKKYISSFEYNQDKFRKHGVSKVEFLTPPGEDTPRHYEGIIMGFEDNYREKHVGRPIGDDVIKYFKNKNKKEGKRDCEWQRELLRNKGKISTEKKKQENQPQTDHIIQPHAVAQ